MIRKQRAAVRREAVSNLLAGKLVGVRGRNYKQDVDRAAARGVAAFNTRDDVLPGTTVTVLSV